VATFVLCGIWLVVNHLDNQAVDYPVIRAKYRFLLAIALLLLIESYLQARYFLALRAEVITSCCGALFGQQAEGLAGTLTALPASGTRIAFYLGVALTLRTGLHFLFTGRTAALFAALAGGLMVLSLTAVVSFISVYYYELPTHHCPFCLLQREYHYIGYPLYLSLLSATIAGVSVGVLQCFKGRPSLEAVIPGLQKKLCLVSLLGYAIFTLIATYPQVFSSFRLDG
jgi:hypothetical protein